MSGTIQPIGELSRLVSSLQELIRASYLTQQTLAHGLTVNTTLPAYTVSNLPATAPLGVIAFASNGRNPGEGAGVGTGCPVFGNGAGVWKAVWSGVAVTV